MQINFCAKTEKMILCHSGKNRHKKDSKNEINRSISLIYESHSQLFHDLRVSTDPDEQFTSFEAQVD